MPVKRLAVGSSPIIELPHCSGALEVHGHAYEELTIEAADPELTVTASEEMVQIAPLGSSCTLAIPAGAALRAGRIEGSVRLKNLTGPTTIEHLDGHCAARRIGALSVGFIEGEVRIRDSQEPQSFGRIMGHCTLRDILAPITAEHIEGHFLGSNIPAGARIDRIDGNVTIRTHFAPGSESVFGQIAGSVVISVPADASVRFIIESESRLQLDRNLQAVREGTERVVVIGEGAAVVRLSAKGAIRIKGWGYYREERDFDRSFDDFHMKMDDVFTQIDAQLQGFGPDLDLLPEHVRGRVSRKLGEARRKMESARRRVQDAVENAQRTVDVPYVSRMDIPPAPGMPGVMKRIEPVSEQERMLVLQMLEQGKITVQQAQQLLNALEGEP